MIAKPPHRAHEMLQVCNPVLSESLSLVVNKRTNGASQRHYRHRGRRFETRNQPDQIANQNEECQGHQKGRDSVHCGGR